MNPEELRQLAAPPPQDPALAALWWAAKGDWEKAHECAQHGEGGRADWVHAYLHRLEGDLPNARYWYGRAGKTPPSGDLDAEWEAIAAKMLRE